MAYRSCTGVSIGAVGGKAGVAARYGGNAFVLPRLFFSLTARAALCSARNGIVAGRLRARDVERHGDCNKINISNTNHLTSIF